MLTTLRLQELFDYLPSGQLVRKVSVASNATAGDVAGCARKDDRVFISVDGKKYRAHRLIWLWHGNQPVRRIDHKNRNSLDNRIENLRPCENTENAWNARISKANTSGVKGVSWNPLSSTWRVRVRANGRNMSLGCFDDFELAELVSIEARAKHHGAFAFANAH